MARASSAKDVSRPRYVVDDTGKRVGVILPLDVYEQLIEDRDELDDIRAYDAAKHEGGEPVPWEAVRERLDQMTDDDTGSRSSRAR